MKKRNFLSLLASAPLLGLFKEKAVPYTLTAGYIKPCGKPIPYDNVMTVEKLEEMSRWALKHRIKPLKLPNGKEYYIWCVEPNRWNKYFI